jgi:integrase
VSAILRHAGVEFKLKRPKGAKGRMVTDWLGPEDAFGIIASAEQFDSEFAALLKFLLYTGVRLGAALNLQREDTQAAESARQKASRLPMCDCARICARRLPPTSPATRTAGYFVSAKAAI